MNTLKQYNISYINLSLGMHRFDFEVNDAFFTHFEESEITRSNLKIGIDLIKESSMMVLEIKLSGEVEVNCDRCLDPFWLPLESDYRLIVKYGDVYQEQSDEVIIIPFGEGPLYLGQMIYEYVHLSLPFKKVHPEDEAGVPACNPQALEKLSHYLVGTDEEMPEDIQQGEEKSEKPEDPRWDALRKLKFN